MKKITYDIESNLEESHWWFAGRRRLLNFLLSSVPVNKDSPIIDIGCGVGSNLRVIQSNGFKPIGIDSAMYSLTLAQGHHSTVPLVNGDLLRLPIRGNSIGLIIATDILEHLDDDTAGIREIYRALGTEAKVIFTVPAFGFLWGIQDVVGMHKRRYSKKEFLRKLEREGFQIVRSSYFNFFLFFPILLARRMIRFLGLKMESENKINAPLVNFFLKAVFSLEPLILKFIRFPFGVSIFCVAQKR